MRCGPTSVAVSRSDRAAGLGMECERVPSGYGMVSQWSVILPCRPVWVGDDWMWGGEKNGLSQGVEVPPLFAYASASASASSSFLPGRSPFESAAFVVC